MLTPSSTELYSRPNLVPIDEIADHVAMALKAVATHERKAVVTVTYAATWSEETQKLHLHTVVKSKRPVRSNRNEEIIEEDRHVLTLMHETPGQQRIPVGDDPVADLVRLTKEHGVEVSIEAGGRKVTIGKDAAAGAD